MRRSLRIGAVISSILITLGATVAPSQAAAPKPGTTCKTLGQKIVSSKLTYTCTKSGSRLIWSKGYKLPLRVTTRTLPAAISGKTYRATIVVTGGTGYHFCKLQKGSGLPPGYSLNLKTCIITGRGEILPAGTTRRVSPPFVILVTDSTTPKPATVRLTTSIITYPPPPVITVNQVTCRVSVDCIVLVATATGGTAPYTFRSGSGFPPMGLSIWTDVDGGYLRGVARSASLGYSFQVCVVDLAGRSACKTATVVILPTPTSVVSVLKSGDGKGTIFTEPGEMLCGNICQGTYTTDTRLTLWAIPEKGSIFTGWSGDCTGSDNCDLAVNANKTVTATFTLNSSGTYSGIAVIPNLNTPGFNGCPAENRNMTLTIVETEGGKISGKGSTSFSGTRVGNVITVTASPNPGPRGPYTWQWDGTNLTGQLPWFCVNLSTQVILNESTYTFSFKRS